MAEQIPTADYQYLFRRLVKFLGVAANNSPDGDQVAPESVYTADFLKKQLIQSDAEVQLLIASVEDHPFRNAYFDGDALGVRDNETIPAYLGVNGGVMISQPENLDNWSAETENVWRTGILAQSLAHLERTREKVEKFPHLIPDSAKYLYWIENGLMKMVADNLIAAVRVPQITFADAAADSPVFGTPRALQNAVLAHSIATLLPLGADSAHRAGWTQIWLTAKQMIEGKNLNIPSPEQLQRLGS